MIASSNDSLRIFWAISLPQDVKATLRTLQTRLRPRLPSGSWPRLEGLHLTLAFLGDQAAAGVPAMVHAIERGLAECAPFALDTAGIGAFPQLKRARVLFLALREEPRLRALAAELRLSLKQQGVSFDEKPFKPHLTLARFRNPVDVSEGLEPLETLRFEVRGITLYRSHLTPQGARYEALGEVVFR